MTDKTVYIEPYVRRYHANPECSVLKEGTEGQPVVTITGPELPGFLRPCTICVPPIDSDEHGQPTKEDDNGKR